MAHEKEHVCGLQTAAVEGVDDEMTPPERTVEVIHWPGTRHPIEIEVVEGLHVNDADDVGESIKILASASLTPTAARRLVRGIEKALALVARTTAAQRAKARQPTKTTPAIRERPKRRAK